MGAPATGQRVMNLLGMAQKAGRIVSGSTAVEQAVKGKHAKSLLVAADAAEETRGDYEELARRYHIPLFVCLTKEFLGRCLGKEQRAAVALLDEGFSRALSKLMEEGKD